MDKQDPLWEVLGKSPQREPNPWFAAKTLARYRREQTPTWLARILSIRSLSTSLAVLFVVFFLLSWHRQEEAQRLTQIDMAIEYLQEGDELWSDSDTSL